MKVKTILVSQPEPSSEKSPYKRLKEKLKLTIDLDLLFMLRAQAQKKFVNKKLILIILIM